MIENHATHVDASEGRAWVDSSRRQALSGDQSPVELPIIQRLGKVLLKKQMRTIII